MSQTFRTRIIELGHKLDEGDFDIWLANHQGLLMGDILGWEDPDEDDDNETDEPDSKQS